MVKEKSFRKQNKKSLSSPTGNITFTILILAYGYITVVTPNLSAFDSNGPKFLTLSILNIVALLVLLTRKEITNDPEWPAPFFRNPIGIVYTLILLVTLLSFVKAINHIEALLTFSKVFTVFAAAFIIAVIVRRDNRYLLYLSVGMTSLLIIDSLTVFYHIAENILAGRGPSIYEIKSVYSNKNILTASIFVKIPFALWLVTFDNGWRKSFGMASLFLAFVATLFMSSRAFYIGLIVLFAFYLAFMIVWYVRNNEKKKLLRIVVYSAVVLIAGFIVFSGTLKFLFPSSNREANMLGFVSRFKTILQGEQGRTEGWKRSFKLIGEEPLLGVGTGNWKVVVLKYENLTSPDYIYMYKNHNDFIENTAETGIFGGMLFLSVFLITFYNFIKAVKKTGVKDESYKYLFIPAFGLLCYFFDAFFNFPSDRPEILSLFALYVGVGIGYSPGVGLNHRLFGESQGIWKSKMANVTIVAMFIGGMLLSAFVFYQNFVSLKLQRLLAEDMSTGKLTLSSDIFITGFPGIPDLNVQGEPIAVQKARYLIFEKKYEEAIDLLKKDHSSPYDTRPEFFVSTCYAETGNLDSALVYYNKVFRQKPHFYGNTRNMVSVLQAKGRFEEAAGLMSNYLGIVKTNNEAWVFGADLLHKAGNDPKAVIMADSALQYFPEDNQILELKRSLTDAIKIKPFEKVYQQALNAYNEKRYNESCKQFSEFISNEPNVAAAYEYRAFCYYFKEDYLKSILDVDEAVAKGIKKANLYNLRGVDNHMLGNKVAACSDFEKAVAMGDKDAQTNYDQYCKTKTN